MPVDDSSQCDEKCADNILTYAYKNFINNDIKTHLKIQMIQIAMQIKTLLQVNISKQHIL